MHHVRRLPEDPALWLKAPGPITGSSYGIRVDPLPEGDGTFVHVPASPGGATWDPERVSAEVAAGHYKLILLPDSMYCLVPRGTARLQQCRTVTATLGACLRMCTPL